MVTAKLAIMGEIDVKEPDGSTQHFPMALLITFDNPEQIRRAIKEGECKFVFGDGE